MNFEIKLKPDEKVYRSFNTPTHIMGRNWFTLSPEESFGYGKFTYAYKLKEDLPLIDFTSIHFYNDFLSKLKEIDPNIKAGLKTSLRNLLLFPVGFSDLHTYYEFAKNHIKPPNIIEFHKISEEIKTECQLYNNRSRHSDSVVDVLFIDYIKSVYGKYYKGIVMKYKLPNILQNSHQHTEICLFDANNVEPIHEIQRPQIGGQFLSQKTSMPLENAISFINGFRELVLSPNSGFNDETIQKYQEYKDLDEIEEIYNIKIQRPSDKNKQINMNMITFLNKSDNQPTNRKRPAYQKTRKNRK
jgi:hypothetical protein